MKDIKQPEHWLCMVGRHALPLEELTPSAMIMMWMRLEDLVDWNDC